MPELSIIIVNYNSGNFLAQTLCSLRKFPPSVSWNAVVIDNDSSDDSLKQAVDAVSGDDNFRFIESRDNLGFAAGNNKAIAETESELILLLNPDTKVTDGALDILIEQIKQNDDYGAIGARLIDANSDNTVSFGWFPTARGILADAFLPRRFQSPKSGGLGIAPDDSITAPFDVDYVSGACLMTKRDIWNAIGQLDENYFAYFEETDWCIRLKSKGYRVMFIPGAAVYHFEGRSFSEIPYRKMEIFVSSAKRFFKLHYPPGLCSLYLTANVVASALKIVYLAVTGWFSRNRKKRVAPILAHHKAFLRALTKRRTAK